MKQKLNTDLSASEAIYAFVAWLSTREDVTKMGHKSNCAPLCELIKEFCETNNLADPRDNYTDYFEMPVGDIK